MKITRNNQEIELTFEEMMNIYYAMDDHYRQEDIRQHAEENEIHLTDDDVDKISQIAERYLNNNDCYMDIYWNEIDAAVNEYMTEHKHFIRVNTAVGTFYADRFDDSFDKIRLYDSQCNYLDYWEPETIVGFAEDENCTPYEWWNKTLKALESVDNINWLLMYLGVECSLVTKDKQELCDFMCDEDAENNDMVNKIGDYYIVVRD